MPDAPHVARLDETVDILLYASQSCFKGPPLSQLEDIRAHAAQRNAHLGVHTALLYQSGWFVQWLEGPGSSVRALLAHVAKDQRHKNLRLIHASHGLRNLHEPWSMALVLAGESREDFGQRVQALHEARTHHQTQAPAATWRLLTTPLTHPRAQEQAHGDRFQRVMVCSVRPDTSFSLVEWLAETHQEPVVRRRFAGMAGQDVATDYVDFIDHDHVFRVIAMARNGILLGLTRAFMPDYTQVVLLLNGDATFGLQMMSQLVQACSTLRHHPVLIGIGPNAQEHQALRVAAQQAHLIYIDATLADPSGAAQQWQTLRPLLKP